MLVKTRANGWLCCAVAVIVMLTTAFALPAVTGSAEKVYGAEEGGLTYYIKNDSYGYGAYVTDYNGTSVTVPSKLGGQPVVSISLENSGLTSLDITACDELKYLGCGWNRLSALDVSENEELEALYCERNLLTSLDVGANIALEYL
jgi:hypothetical protein